MKKDKKNSVKKLWAVVWAAVVTAVLVGIVSGAAYINRNSVKRVVSTQSGSGTAFSSNYLMPVTKDTSAYILKNVSFSKSAETTELEIDVCNYVQNDPSKVNENDIEYTLTLTLLNTDGTENTSSDIGSLSVKYKNVTYNFANGVCIIADQKLVGNTKSVNTYTLTVPKALVNNINIQAVAEPSSSSYSATGGYKLGRIFTFSDYNATATWTGSFAETATDNYDAFNYVLKGQGKGTVTLTWDPEQLEISKIFLDNNNLQAESGTGNTKILTIEVDSNNKQSRYDIQFYKTENGVYTDMNTVEGYVTVVYTEASD